MPSSSILILHLQPEGRQWCIGMVAPELTDDHRQKALLVPERREQSRKLLLVPDSASMLTHSLLCFKVGKRFLSRAPLLLTFEKSVENQEEQSHSLYHLL